MNNWGGLLIIMILTIIGYKKIQLSRKRLLFLLTIIVLIPLWWQHQLYQETLMNMLILSCGWAIYLLVDQKYIKIAITIILILLSAYFISKNAGLISEGKIDQSRSYWVDNKNQAELTKFQQMSLFLPYISRRIVWGNWWQITETVLRGMSGLSGEIIWPTIGPALWFLAIVSLYYRTEWEVGMAIFCVVVIGWLSRNPNTNLISAYLLPAIVVLSLPAIKKVNLKILTVLSLITLPFIF